MYSVRLEEYMYRSGECMKDGVDLYETTMILSIMVKIVFFIMIRGCRYLYGANLKRWNLSLEPRGQIKTWRDSAK